MTSGAKEQHQLANSPTSGLFTNTSFPSNLYFIDAESYEKQPAAALDPGMAVPEEILQFLGSDGEVPCQQHLLYKVANRPQQKRC
jgi:hypothetical protein